MEQQDIVRQFVTLVAEKRQLEARLREINADLDHLEPSVLEYYADIGAYNQSLDVDGERYTIFVVPVVRARAKAGLSTELAQALVGSGHPELVKNSVHAGTLTAWVKEMEEADGIPAAVEPYLAISRYTEVHVNHVAASR